LLLPSQPIPVYCCLLTCWREGFRSQLEKINVIIIYGLVDTKLHSMHTKLHLCYFASHAWEECRVFLSSDVQVPRIYEEKLPDKNGYQHDDQRASCMTLGRVLCLFACILFCTGKFHEILFLWKAWVVKGGVSHCVVSHCHDEENQQESWCTPLTILFLLLKVLLLLIPVHGGIIWVSVCLPVKQVQTSSSSLQHTLILHYFFMRHKIYVFIARESFVRVKWSHHTIILLQHYFHTFSPSYWWHHDHQCWELTRLLSSNILPCFCWKIRADSEKNWLKGIRNPEPLQILHRHSYPMYAALWSMLTPWTMCVDAGGMHGGLTIRAVPGLLEPLQHH
jgi:hypothetical protein